MKRYKVLQKQGFCYKSISEHKRKDEAMLYARREEKPFNYCVVLDGKGYLPLDASLEDLPYGVEILADGVELTIAKLKEESDIYRSKKQRDTIILIMAWIAGITILVLPLW
ncbi:MAG: hypothetical protein WCR69_04490 [Sulfuricurvum sp.]